MKNKNWIKIGFLNYGFLILNIEFILESIDKIKNIKMF